VWGGERKEEREGKKKCEKKKWVKGVCERKGRVSKGGESESEKEKRE
jgi:hypothetical protein